MVYNSNQRNARRIEMSTTINIPYRRRNDIAVEKLTFAGTTDANGREAVFYCSFSELGRTWPEVISIGGIHYKFDSQEPLEYSESGVFAGRAKYIV